MWVHPMLRCPPSYTQDTRKHGLASISAQWMRTENTPAIQSVRRVYEKRVSPHLLKQSSCFGIQCAVRIGCDEETLDHEENMFDPKRRRPVFLQRRHTYFTTGVDVGMKD